MTPPWPSWPRAPLARDPFDKLARGVEPRRVSFAGPQASAVWARRLPRLAEAALSAELALVRDGALPASVIWASYDALGPFLRRLESIGLAACPIRTAVGPLSSYDAEANSNFDKLMNYGLLVARSPIEAASTRLAESDPADTARWLKWPPCCAESWADRLRDGLTDPIAAMLSCPTSDTAPSHAHALLAGLGLGPVRHAPCTAACRHTADAAEAFITAVAKLGFTDEADWLRSMGGWTVDVSVSAGIAEVKTSVLRYAHLSDRLPARVDLRFTGHIVPEGTPAGLTAPFAAPRAKKSRSVRPKSRADLHADFPTSFARSGFASAISMRSRFSTALWEHSATLRRAVGGAVHLGCGDGLLLELLTQQRAGLTIIGVETDIGLADVARRRPSLSGATFLSAPWPEALASVAAMAISEPLVFFDLEAFAEYSPSARAGIRRGLASHGAVAIAIANDRALQRAGDIDDLASAAGLSLVPGRSARASGRVQHDPKEVESIAG